MRVCIYHKKNTQYLLEDILVANDQIAKPPGIACLMTLDAWGHLKVAEAQTKTFHYMAVYNYVYWIVLVLPRVEFKPFKPKHHVFANQKFTAL